MWTLEGEYQDGEGIKKENLTDERFSSQDVMTERDVWVLPGKENIAEKSKRAREKEEKGKSRLGRKLFCNLSAFKTEAFPISN